jgi:DNA-binding transcriptional MerR regulator
MNLSQDELLDTKAAADRLGKSVDQLRRLVKHGKLKPISRARNYMLFSRKDLELFSESTSPASD